MKCITERDSTGRIVRLENHVFLDQTKCIGCDLTYAEAAPVIAQCRVVCDVHLDTGEVRLPDRDNDA